MSFQEVIQTYRDEIMININTENMSDDNIIMQNFEDHCIANNILPLTISYGEQKQEELEAGFRQTVEKAWTELILPINLVRPFIDAINFQGTVVAEKIRCLRDDMYNTVSPSLIPSYTISFTRSAETLETISTMQFEEERRCKFIMPKSIYEFDLFDIGLTEYDTVGRVFVVDPRTDKKANAQPGLFTEIGRVIRLITDTHNESL
jgi:hypothetical protein